MKPGASRGTVRETVRCADPYLTHMKQTVLRLALIAAALVAVSLAVIVVNQSAQLVELAGRLHPIAGQAVFWGLLLFYAACIAVPVVMWVRLPRSLMPPVTGEGPAFERHVADLRKRLRCNPALQRRHTGPVPLGSREEIEAALQILDEEANEVIKAAASRVFVSTALSQNGSLDSLLVVGLQSRLVWQVAHVYRQRPSLREFGWLYANVAATAFVAGEIEDLDLAEQVQPVIQNALGAAASSVPGLQAASAVLLGSMISGSANAFLTLRVGIVARRYCGALVLPEKRGLRRSAFAEATGMLGAVAASGSKKVITALAKASGRTVGRTVSGIGAKVKDGAGSVGSSVKSGAGAVANTLRFRRKDEDEPPS